jgi:hypothetical protein
MIAARYHDGLSPVKSKFWFWTWVLDAAVLFYLALALVRPIYKAEYLAAWNSIESTFISDARFLRENWPHPRWQPNWYGGTRFDYVYPPALRYGTAAISLVKKKCSTAKAYHIYIAVLYAIGIAGVYWLVRAGSRSRWVALWAGAATAVVSPGFLFFYSFLLDYGNLHWMPLRLGVLVRYGEGPHMSSLALLAPALAAAWYGLRRQYPRHLAGAAILSAAVVAHNFYGATALALFFPVLAWSVWVTEQDRMVWARAAGIALLAWGLSAFWFTPSYVRVTLDNMLLVSSAGHGWSAALLAAVAAGYAFLSWRWARGKPERAWPVFVLGSLAVYGLNVIGHVYFDFRVIGEPGRLMPEFDLVVLMAIGTGLVWLGRRGRVGAVAAVVLALACLAPGIGYVQNAHRILPPHASRAGRIEVQLTDWIAANLPGVRVLATGSLRFWYNAWHDLPQLGGGSEQGLLNPNANFGYYHALADDNIDFCIDWLRATGAGAVAVHDKESSEIYHDFEKPKKFEGKLEKIFDNEKGDRIYRVPRRYAALARVVDSAAMRSIRSSPPEPDIPALSRYVNAVERGPEAEVRLRRQGPDEMALAAEVGPGQSLLVQESYDPAWRATVNGCDVPVSRDPFGFLLIDPGPGRHEVGLRFEMPLENRIGWGMLAVSLAIVGWLFGRRREAAR